MLKLAHPQVLPLWAHMQSSPYLELCNGTDFILQKRVKGGICRVHTGGRGRQAHAHAGIDDGDVIVAAVCLFELAHEFTRLREGDRHARQHLMWLQIHPAVAQEEVLR